MQPVRKISDPASPSEVSRSPTYSLDLLARKSDGLRRFADCVLSAGLGDTFATKGPFTIFAPNDAAFEKLPADTFELLLRDSAKLKAILNYHVINGFVPFRELKSGDMATLQGNSIAVAVSQDGIRINGANITASDLTATNGVVHSIDELLLPPKWRLPGSASRA